MTAALAASVGVDASQLKLAPLSNQVAGHPAGVQSLEDGKLVVKECLAQELDFYHAVDRAASESAGSPSKQEHLLTRLSHFMPEFHGSWHDYLAAHHDGPPGANRDAAAEQRRPPSPSRIVLENLTCSYDKANVCDIKLGTQLYDDDASDEKRQRMQLASQNTTSGMCGLRLTGWQVWDNQTSTYHTVPKTFGKTVQAPDLILGARMLLASPKAGDAQRAESILAGSSRVRVLPPPPADGDAIDAALVKDESGLYLPELPPAAMRTLIEQSILPALEQLVDIFSQLEIRMRGGSLLLVYEGSAEGLEQGLGPQPRTISTGRLPQRDGAKRLVDLRVIDFAHATLVEGQGPDEGVLLGIRTTLQLFRSVLEDLDGTR
ncbi:uncharacterized protein PFL1_02922 [Pseudozyma flocculosa PF-1]|uniref:Kinase n=2 Tax=Pseudozyma flocculosa TaxID=84751 RepID=A0A5C3F1H3_9BASI|nr:uncharacterized protein PFL1_02922 [Pseudozyma flocculosa PF-1]EPQ29702.1 hypothetical protein PFL1_02922 [Pseudozyma flocculosa PF-1]SPO38278.1 related to ARG82 - dual-specificity inositol polyphosphate kinase required for regulation of phosphate-and nitrogen-responsive genes [Pseudozyma flocculosa]